MRIGVIHDTISFKGMRIPRKASAPDASTEHVFELKMRQVLTQQTVLLTMRHGSCLERVMQKLMECLACPVPWHPDQPHLAEWQAFLHERFCSTWTNRWKLATWLRSRQPSTRVCSRKMAKRMNTPCRNPRSSLKISEAHLLTLMTKRLQRMLLMANTSFQCPHPSSHGCWQGRPSVMLLARSAARKTCTKRCNVSPQSLAPNLMTS